MPDAVAAVPAAGWVQEGAWTEPDGGCGLTGMSGLEGSCDTGLPAMTAGVALGTLLAEGLEDACCMPEPVRGVAAAPLPV